MDRQQEIAEELRKGLGTAPIEWQQIHLLKHIAVSLRSISESLQEMRESQVRQDQAPL